MSISESTRKALVDCGLTNYETRAYAALIHNASMTAAKVSQEANIPYSKIYEVLGSLERKGWVETQRNRPSKYFPKPPAEAIETVKLKLESKFKNNESTIIAELQPVYDAKGLNERPDIWIVRGDLNALVKIKEIINRCQNELLIATPLLTKTVFQLLYTLLLTLKDRSVSIRIMTSKSVNPRLVKALNEVADVRLRDKMFGGGVVVDGREVVLLLGEENERDSRLAIWSNHVSLAKLAKSYFGFLWDSA